VNREKAKATTRRVAKKAEIESLPITLHGEVIRDGELKAGDAE
jgi:hypothetical protein